MDFKKMRLKYFFFPIMLVVSLSIFIGFVLPEITSINQLNTEKIAKENELKIVLDKKAAIELAGQKIDSIEGEKIVDNYLPKNRAEERIIGDVNYLASDAGVSLANISLVDARNVSAPIISSAAALPGQSIADVPNLLQSTHAKIALAGDYSKIKIFLDNLQRMQIFNTIKSVKISKQLSKADSDNEVGDGSSTLTADVEVDFGYLNGAKIGNIKIGNFDPVIDEEVVSVLNGYISKKSQLLGDASAASGEAGSRTNPFFIN